MSEIVVGFLNADIPQANALAQSLKEAIQDEAPGAQVEQRREDREAQDFGATLGILLAGPAVVAIAKGIQQWLVRHHSVTLEIKTTEGRVIAKNVTANNVVEIINAVRSKDPT